MTTEEPSITPAKESASVWPYVMPLITFLALSALEGYLPRGTGDVPSPIWYPWAYAAKVAIVSGVLWACRSTFRDLLPIPSGGAIAFSIGLGLAVALAWVGLDGWYPEIPLLGKRIGFDPKTIGPIGRPLFILIRLLGLVVLIPIVEEIFYRAFLIRWIIDPDFHRVPIGKVTPLGIGVTTAVFAFSHPEWLPAILTGLAWCWLLWQTRSVSACIISHATANLALGIYVLATGEWKYW
jgi:CAAX prenyl protease-like protein